MAVILDQLDIDVFIGLDVGKSDHHAVALNRAGKKLFDKALPNDESQLRETFDSLSRHVRILLVVDQPATIGALPVAVARPPVRRSATCLDVAARVEALVEAHPLHNLRPRPSPK